MATHELDVAAFRATFPAFANTGTFPDAMIQIYWDLATTYIGPNDGWGLNGAPLQSALNFMTAHVMQSNVMLTGQPTAVIVTSSKVGDVTVTTKPPPTKDMWEWWLATTPYGVMLWALLSARSAGGFYVPGRPERSAFRKVGGRF